MADKNLIELKALRILAIREHSVKELRKKLFSKFSDSKSIEEVLIDFQSKNYLSDKRFAKMYIDMRSKKGFGPLRIRSELADRGIDRDIVEPELKRLSEDWPSLLKKTASSRFGCTRENDTENMSKMVRFLNYRGFPESLIRRYLLD